MKGLVFSAYYEPEIAASLYLSTNLYEDMAISGIEVSLFVPTPTRGVDDALRKVYLTEKKCEYKCDGRLRIKRVALPREGKRTISRAVRYLLVNMAFIIKSFTVKSDFVFVQSTPPTQGAMAAIIKKIKRIPLIYNLQDVFPDSLVGTGLTNEGSLVYRIGRIIEDFTYRNCDKIIVISADMKENIIRKGVPAEKVFIVRNWVDGDSVRPIEKKDNYLFEKYNIARDKFNVVYAGNLGYAQNIEVILFAAELLKDKKDIQFLIFGKGNQEDEYKQLAKQMQLDNVFFFPIQPYSQVSYVYSLGETSIVPCKKGFGGSAMPSKTWSILATGTPIIASFDEDTELERLLNDNSLGLFGRAGDAEEMAHNILKLYSMKDSIYEYKERALNYIFNNSSREVATKQYIDIIINSIKS